MKNNFIINDKYFWIDKIKYEELSSFIPFLDSSCNYEYLYMKYEENIHIINEILDKRLSICFGIDRNCQNELLSSKNDNETLTFLKNNIMSKGYNVYDSFLISKHYKNGRGFLYGTVGPEGELSINEMKLILIKLILIDINLNDIIK